MIDRHVRITSYLEKYSNGNTHLKENKWGEKIKRVRTLKGQENKTGRENPALQNKQKNNYLASLGNR